MKVRVFQTRIALETPSQCHGWLLLLCGAKTGKPAHLLTLQTNSAAAVLPGNKVQSQSLSDAKLLLSVRDRMEGNMHEPTVRWVIMSTMIP